MLVHIFMNTSTGTAIDTGVIFLRIVVPFYFIVATKLIADGILRGTGAMKEFMIGTFSDLILRVLLAILFSKEFGAVGIWCAWPFGWTISTIISVCFYKKGVWKKA
jgi:Na+-driven multidrug efflux pump